MQGHGDKGTHFVLNTRVLSLSVLTNENRVHVIVRRLVALDGHTRTDVGEEVECPTQCQVQRDVALADCTAGQQQVGMPVASTYSA